MSRYLIGNIAVVVKAIRICEAAHVGQQRKVSGDPYFHHPVAVAFLVAAFKRSKRLGELICAAILHDTLEDTKLSFQDTALDFSPFVASLVLELTNDEVEMRRIGKLEYQKKKLVGISSYVLTVKLADRLHNLVDHPNAKTVEQTVELLQYLAAPRKLTETQEAMTEEIFRLCV